MASELCPVALKTQSQRQRAQPALGEEFSGRRGVWQRDQPPRQRGSLTILPAPQPLPAKLHNWERDPHSIHSQGAGCAVFPPQRKDSAGPLGQVSAHNHFCHQVPVPGRREGVGPWDRLPAGCCRCAVREFQATPPRAKVKGCQVPVSSEQVLVDCAGGAMQALCE